jgi:hypothetical protein
MADSDRPFFILLRGRRLFELRLGDVAAVCQFHHVGSCVGSLGGGVAFAKPFERAVFQQKRFGGSQSLGVKQILNS